MRFINDNPGVMAEVKDIEERYKKIKTKVMNERNKTRRLFEERKANLTGIEISLLLFMAFYDFVNSPDSKVSFCYH